MPNGLNLNNSDLRAITQSRAKALAEDADAIHFAALSLSTTINELNFSESADGYKPWAETLQVIKSRLDCACESLNRLRNVVYVLDGEVNNDAAEEEN